MIRRGCGDWGCFCGTAHSIPFAVEGKCSSVVVKLLPAPKGTGLVVESELKKMLSISRNQRRVVKKLQDKVKTRLI